MSSSQPEWDQESGNGPKSAWMSKNETKYVQIDRFWAQNVLKLAQMSLNERKSA